MSRVSVKERCKPVDCLKPSRWGIDDKPPTHCPDHTPLDNESAVYTVETARAKGGYRYSPSLGPSAHLDDNDGGDGETVVKGTRHRLYRKPLSAVKDEHPTLKKDAS